MSRYNPAIIEPKWQKYWEENQTFAAPRLPKEGANNRDGQKIYVLDMFPYPSANGLHVGHPEGYTATDIVCRFNRMNGVSVMHPMGWDAFGLPAEQHAKKTGIHPRETTEKNIANFRRQLKMLGFSYDWNRELATTDLAYFRWTQRIFLLLYETWFDKSLQKGRPIEELPIPESVRSEGSDAVRQYIDDHRLAYQIEAPVNWCPELGTVLANEEVIGGVSERGGYPVMRLPLRQWMLRITAYADRLENDLDQLDWSESIKLLQRNWIGKSLGAEVDFFIGQASEFENWKENRRQNGFPRKANDDVLRVFTTRPDTLFGATYMVIAPEHPAVKRLTTTEQREAVQQYCERAAFKSDLDRTDLAKEKTGVFSGSYAINPVNGQPIPVWIADYVLISYGTGAIMAVPAHDTRDFEFSTKFNILKRQVVRPTSKSSVSEEEASQMTSAFTEQGVAINSGAYNGMSTADFKAKISDDLAEWGLGRKTANYKLRDWLFSRQHFWGEPFPLLRELDENGQPNGIIRALKPEELPLDLPEGIRFELEHHSPEPPLEKSPQDWLFVELDGKKYKRETNTMPQWAGSCWYYLRYLDPRNSDYLVDPEIEKAWMPVDLYVGGAEHAVLHLLYARFWHKVLYDRGFVSTKEPFHKLVNQGMILGEMEFTGYQTQNGQWISAQEVNVDNQQKAFRKSNEQNDSRPPEELVSIKLDSKQLMKKGESFVLQENDSIVVDSKSYKMSKSRGNVINPDEVVAQFGADSLRLYEMFMGPLEAVKPWSQDGVSGVRGFLDKVWRMIVSFEADDLILNAAIQTVEPTDDQNRILHKTIKAVTQDIRSMSFNTAIARMMEFSNFFSRQEIRPKSAMETFVLLLSPFAPHLSEELWELLGHSSSLAYENWPIWDEAALVESTVIIPVQVNGKLRNKLEMPANVDAETMEQQAKSDTKVASWLEGKTIVKKIIVPGKMINFVVK
ncbi:MAG: leucine--tRNA ligase [Planctomycetia bacterium]|nr:leucine--tRNA ligase [Planctomycetia bacterium]